MDDRAATWRLASLAGVLAGLFHYSGAFDVRTCASISFANEPSVVDGSCTACTLLSQVCYTSFHQLILHLSAFKMIKIDSVWYAVLS
jgi:hypothetical protein